METVRFSPEELIIREGVQDDCSIYIIQRGCVELELKGRALKKLHIGESFGERSFFTGFTRVCSIRAVGFVKLYKITQQSAL
jgi:CRP-like cAMP-binding protein